MRKIKEGTFKVIIKEKKLISLIEKSGTVYAPDDLEILEFKKVNDLIDFVYEKEIDISNFYDLSVEHTFKKERSRDIAALFGFRMHKILRKDKKFYNKKEGYGVQKKDLSNNDLGGQSDQLSAEAWELARKQGDKSERVSKNK